MNIEEEKKMKKFSSFFYNFSTINYPEETEKLSFSNF